MAGRGHAPYVARQPHHTTGRPDRAAKAGQTVRQGGRGSRSRHRVAGVTSGREVVPPPDETSLPQPAPGPSSASYRGPARRAYRPHGITATGTHHRTRPASHTPHKPDAQPTIPTTHTTGKPQGVRPANTTGTTQTANPQPRTPNLEPGTGRTTGRKPETATSGRTQAHAPHPAGTQNPLAHQAGHRTANRDQRSAGPHQTRHSTRPGST